MGYADIRGGSLDRGHRIESVVVENAISASCGRYNLSKFHI